MQEVGPGPGPSGRCKDNGERKLGTVVSYSYYHGTGRIKGDDGQEYYIHRNEVFTEDRELQKGQKVSFTPYLWWKDNKLCAGLVHVEPRK